jgi:hypothetical protein
MKYVETRIERLRATKNKKSPSVGSLPMLRRLSIDFSIFHGNPPLTALELLTVRQGKKQSSVKGEHNKLCYWLDLRKFFPLNRKERKKGKVFNSKVLIDAALKICSMRLNDGEIDY